MPPCRVFPALSFWLVLYHQHSKSWRKQRENKETKSRKGKKEEKLGYRIFYIFNVNCLHWGEYLILILDLSFFIFFCFCCRDPLIPCNFGWGWGQSRSLKASKGFCPLCSKSSPPQRFVATSLLSGISVLPQRITLLLVPHNAATNPRERDPAFFFFFVPSGHFYYFLVHYTSHIRCKPHFLHTTTTLTHNALHHGFPCRWFPILRPGWSPSALIPSLSLDSPDCRIWRFFYNGPLAFHPDPIRDGNNQRASAFLARLALLFLFACIASE